MTQPPLPPGRNEPGVGKAGASGHGADPGSGRRMIADRGPLAALEGWTLSLESGSDRDMPGEDPYARRSFLYAFLAHGILVAMLVMGVQWVTRESAPMQAEMWGALPETAPPPTPPPPPAPEPLPKPEPKPLPKPEPKAEPKPEPKPEVKPDIALEEKKKKLKEEKRLKEEQLKEEKLRKEQEKQEALKEEQRKKEELKEEKRKQELAKQEEQKKREAEQAEKRRQAELEKAIQRELEKEREREREKALSDLINKDTARVAGGMPQAGGGSGVNRDPTYIDRIIAKIRSNLVGSACDALPGNPEAIFIVEQLRNGTVVKIAKRKSTGSTSCDDAIERAINKSDPLPTAKEGSYARDLELSFKPKEGR